MTTYAPATGRTVDENELREVRYLRAVIDTLRQELVTERKLVKGFEAEATTLRVRLQEAERALKPFAGCWKPYLAAYNPDGCPGWPSMGEVTIADLKRAADLLAIPVLQTKEAGDHEPR